MGDGGGQQERASGGGKREEGRGRVGTPKEGSSRWREGGSMRKEV